MKIAPTIKEMRQQRNTLSGTVGFVPTMGYLHEGHLSLVRRAREQCDWVIVSIYVNPSQFAPSEDLETYPRNMGRDLELLKQEGVDIVFTPDNTQMYPDDFCTWVTPGRIAEPLEGASRPQFFKGVDTIVLKLFNIVRPTHAYFGRKDAQQLRVVKQMVKDLNLDISIVPGDTVREEDGLAMSSRNAYLKDEDRRAALILYLSLQRAKELIEAGERDAEVICNTVRNLVAGDPRSRLDYISVADDVTLEELDTIDRPILISMAVFIGGIRLIDNISLNI